MRYVERHPISGLPKLERTEARDKRLAEMLVQDLEDALTARRPVEGKWIEARRQYEAIPKRPVRDIPVPNAPNIEVPVGAILADDLYSQAVDTLFTASPILSCRPTNERFVEGAKSMQSLIDRMVEKDLLNLRPAANTALLDDTQLGTGFYYIPYVNYVTKARAHKITHRGPKILSMSPEDVILMPGSHGDLQCDRFVALRFWYTPGEMAERVRLNKWTNAKDAVPVARVDLVRMQYERDASLTPNPLWRELYEVIDAYAYFDYDEDGYDEDLLVTFDRHSRTILDLRFNPYDKRPIVPMRFQERAHLPYGIGVMEMSQPFQEETTELHCSNLLNTFLANCRVFVAAQGAVPEDLPIYPGKVIPVNASDVRAAFSQLPMSEINPSAVQSQSFAIGLAERRVGASGSQGFLAKGGSRTPGVTALSLLQQVNKRFAPAFNEMREQTAEAVRQAVERIRERLLGGDKQAEDDIRAVLSEEDADNVIEILKLTGPVSDSVMIEFTAASASVNRDADRQNALLLTDRLGGYYDRILNLAIVASNPQTPPEVKKLIASIVEKGTEIMDRTIRTFEQVRDPQTFLLNVQEQLEDTLNPSGEQGSPLAEILAALGGGGGQEQQGLPEPGFSGVA